MKKDYFNTRRERVKQKARLLIERPDFQRDIVSLRKKWNIPVDGIMGGKLQQWYQDLQEATHKYFVKERPKYKAEVQKLHEAGKLSEAKTRHQEFNDGAPVNAFGKDIWRMIKKHRIAPSWYEGVKRYVLSNMPDSLGGPLGVVIHIEWDMETDMQKLSLIIDADTTRADIEKVWPLIMYYQSQLSYKKQKKIQPIYSLDVQKRAYELQQQGNSYEQIAEILRKEKKGNYTHSYLSTLIKRYKKRLGIN